MGYNTESQNKLSQKLTPSDVPALMGLMADLDADDVLHLIEDFSVCTPETRQRASAMRSEFESLRKAEHLRLEQKEKEELAEDARIQRNALRMADPKQAKELTRQECEEVYRRSLKAMGLNENGPLTPAQKDLIQRMYRTMVLGESGNRPPN
jgi:hypothetical protein